ncbi:phosphoesterase superfamily protein [Talaromyces stipitatus ATCC 10500]|uniref:Phosphoesterase superfamily protein n=1 Tax=Talaromyces stipitatus (strain ATCC 10500 / CBS 375.48 / QM 6759 / NRRL 1006) TaxID=441959 RepID=B8MQW9_TALSN|nr:phosphoesterase superfamily protein [Talaromyces stipitatus ATCC 10500]EED12804.1 phosphoesterase superfamily protein [Talaromyces stipitatus ATCC 10500]
MRPGILVGLLAFAAITAGFPNKRTGLPASKSSIQNLKSKIKNVVILVMENRSFDNLLGGQKLFGLDNPIQHGPFCNPYNVSDPAEGMVCSAARDYDSITDDPDHAVYGNNFEFYSTFTPDNAAIESGQLIPNQNGFIHEQLRLYSSEANRTELATQVMNYYTEEQVPVLTTLVHNFLTFNHWHSDIPGPTNPNRAAIVSGTSYGHGTNDDGFSEHVFPQTSIWQQLTETNHSWTNYWDTAGGTGPDAGYFSWTYETGNNDKIVAMENFYTDAAAGSLPELSYINPSCCGVGTTSMHPSGLVSDGEELIRSVYDALRASPQWEQTLFILTFDESGGFHDHVPPPLAPRPDNLTYTSTTPSGQNYTLSFNRLGGRIPTLLISPWVAKAYVEQKSLNSEGETVSYSASSILRTLGYLWDFEPFNPRVEYSPSFDHLIQSYLRMDTPSSLPKGTAFKS